MKNVNVAFYSPSLELSRSNRLTIKSLMVNPAPFYLHGYFRKHHPEYAQYINWKPGLFINKTTEQIVEFLNENDIDILCAGLYIWNVQHVMSVLRGVKELYKKPLKIVLGGPSCDAVHDDWENQYQFVDHFVIGQGEKAWCNLALDFLGVASIPDNATNIVHLLKKNESLDKEKIYEYEFIRGIHYSPYLECKDLVKELINSYEGFELNWPYETQRGCPYHCTFCDWNGGQSNKTQKRKEVSFIDEIDFFAENKMYSLHISDANFGMWDADVDIMKRMVEHKKNGHNFNFVSFNMSKLINANFKEIMRMIIRHDFNSIWVKLSVQDIHPEVLSAINRPGNWEESKEFGLELYKEFAVEKNLKKIFVELILGLPGQTYESWIKTLDEVYSSGFIPRTYPFLLLRNAPATYDQKYRKEHGIIDDLVFEVLDMTPIGKTIAEVSANRVDNFIHNQIIECNTFTQKDLVRMTMADQLYRRLCSRMNWSGYGFIDMNWHHLKPILVKMIECEDFNYVLEQRYTNFKLHKLNAMDSSSGELLSNGMDMSAIIARNFHIITDSFKSTGIDEKTANKFLADWNTYIPTAHLLNR